MNLTRIDRLLIGVLCAAALATAPSAVAQTPAPAQSKDEQKRQKELQDALQKEAHPILLVVDKMQKEQAADAQTFTVNPKENDPIKALTPATPAVDSKALAWRYDLMKASDGKVYVPYSLTLPPDAMPSGPLSVYLRVTPKGAALPAAEKSDAKSAGPKFPFEDFYAIEPKEAAGKPVLMRAFAAVPGEYDVYLAIRPRLTDPKKAANDPVRVVATKQAVNLPDYWDGGLSTSTVIVTSKVDTLQGQISPEAQREHPYLFGQTEFVPSADNKFKKTDEMSVVFQIYNPTLEAGKPNVTIEYNFHQKLPEGEKFFNKTTPQQLNAQTLPPAFDVVTTQMLPGGQSVPLGSFEPGEYRMEIKITDGIAKKTITRDVTFSVAGA